MIVSRGSLAKSEESVFVDFARRVSLRGSTVVEIGGAVPSRLIEEAGCAAWLSADPRHHDTAPGSARRLVRARGESLPFRDGSADAVFSCNAFQFLNVSATLAEVRRVLRPGGVCFAHFGPIWSAPDGHQLEYVSYQGRDLLFWRDTLIPPYAHLQYMRDELEAVLRTGLPEELARLLVWHVYESPTINRLFFEDYMDAVKESGLICEEVGVSDALDYAIRTPAYRSPPAWEASPQQLQVLVATSTQRRHWLGVRDVRLVLTASPPR